MGGWVGGGGPAPGYTPARHDIIGCSSLPLLPRPSLPTGIVFSCSAPPRLARGHTFLSRTQTIPRKFCFEFP